MSNLPTDWSALCALVFLLGMKHGFDADHLAAIDGLTKHNLRARRGYARYCGTLFSAGHGVVVLGIAAGVSLARHAWQPPGWLELTGAWVTIAFLATIGWLNLRAVWSAAPDETLHPTGLKGRFLGRLMRAEHPVSVACVGALFAVSFDTVSQAALFAVTALKVGGLAHALFLGVLFAGGMMATDAVNGLWISRLIARADQVAVMASRAMSLAIAAMSLLIAAVNLGSLVSPTLARVLDERSLLMSIALCALLAACFLFAHAMGRRSRDARPLLPERADSAR